GRPPAPPRLEQPEAFERRGLVGEPGVPPRLRRRAATTIRRRSRAPPGGRLNHPEANLEQPSRPPAPPRPATTSNTRKEGARGEPGGSPTPSTPGRNHESPPEPGSARREAQPPRSKP